MAYGVGIPVAHGLPANVPVVGAWSNSCSSSVIASNNTSCGNLTAGNTISVQINITNAQIGTVNGYDIFLFYDPNFLSATSVDQTTGIVFTNVIFRDAFLDLPGQIRAAAAAQGFNTDPNGVLFTIFFKILKNGVSPSTLAAAMVRNAFAQSYTELTTPYPLGPTTTDGYFTNIAGNPGPVASFAIPPMVLRGSTVTFNASASYDLDASPPGALNRGISLYE